MCTSIWKLFKTAGFWEQCNDSTAAGACRDATKTYFTRIWNRNAKNNERHVSVCIMRQIKYIFGSDKRLKNESMELQLLTFCNMLQISVECKNLVVEYLLIKPECAFNYTKNSFKKKEQRMIITSFALKLITKFM